jgi:transcriptional regulator with XRE-family HTH domain
METGTNEKIHQGRNVKRFREMMGIKQEAFATELGDDWNQKKVSLLEQKETIEDDLLQQVAKALKVPVEAIKNFDEQAAIVYFNTFNFSLRWCSHSFASPHQPLLRAAVWSSTNGQPL